MTRPDMATKQPSKKTTPAAKKTAGVAATKTAPAANNGENIKVQPVGTPAVPIVEEIDKQSTPIPAPVHAPDPPVGSETPPESQIGPESENVPEIPAAHYFGITEQTVIVIAVNGEAAEAILRAWNKTAAPADIRIVSPAATLAETFESLVADDLLPDEFIFVPGICIPTAKLTLADLALYRRRMLPEGETADYTDLPMHLAKEHIVKALETFGGDPEQTDEILVRHYNEVAHDGELPNQVAFSFGNGVGYVTRPNFCPDLLIEFILRRKFVCLTPEVFPAAKRYLEEYAR